MSFTKSAPAIRAVSINRDDTLKTIALRELGSAAFWVDLVLVNNLKPPYIADVASAGVLSYGDLIKIPDLTSPVEFDTDARAIYGVDLVLRKRLLQVGNGDLSLIAGVPNLVQALRHHVIVGKRELAFHPDYGCWVREVIGATSGPTQVVLASSYVKRAVQEDSRVDYVESCQGVADGDTIRVVARVVPVSGKPIDIELVV